MPVKKAPTGHFGIAEMAALESALHQSL